MRIGVVGVASDGALEASNRLIGVVLFLEQLSEMEMRVGISGFCCKCSLELSDRLVKLAPFAQQRAEIGIRLDIIRLRRDRVAKQVFTERALTALYHNDTQIVERNCVSRLLLKHGSIKPLGFVEFAAQMGSNCLLQRVGWLLGSTLGIRDFGPLGRTG